MNKVEQFNKEVDQLREEQNNNSESWQKYLKQIDVFKKNLLNS
jgi:hypothetical protein